VQTINHGDVQLDEKSKRYLRNQRSASLSKKNGVKKKTIVAAKHEASAIIWQWLSVTA